MNMGIRQGVQQPQMPSQVSHGGRESPSAAAFVSRLNFVDLTIDFFFQIKKVIIINIGAEIQAIEMNNCVSVYILHMPVKHNVHFCPLI